MKRVWVIEWESDPLVFTMPRNNREARLAKILRKHFPEEVAAFEEDNPGGGMSELLDYLYDLKRPIVIYDVELDPQP